MAQKPEELMVTLANGTQVPWTEFKTWTPYKQAKNLVKMSEEARAKISAANKGKTASAETRAKISAAVSARFSDPEVRAQISARSQASNARPEVQERLRQAMKTRMSDANARARIGQATRARWQDPEHAQQRRDAVEKGIAKLTPEQWAARSAKIAKAKLKPIHTPYGCYDSKTQAAQAMLAQGVINAHGKLSVWLKTDPTNYYYL